MLSLGVHILFSLPCLGCLRSVDLENDGDNDIIASGSANLYKVVQDPGCECQGIV
jgi:hypothetical protein